MLRKFNIIMRSKISQRDFAAYVVQTAYLRLVPVPSAFPLAEYASKPLAVSQLGEEVDCQLSSKEEKSGGIFDYVGKIEAYQGRLSQKF